MALSTITVAAQLNDAQVPAPIQVVTFTAQAYTSAGVTGLLAALKAKLGRNVEIVWAQGWSTSGYLLTYAPATDLIKAFATGSGNAAVFADAGSVTINLITFLVICR